MKKSDGHEMVLELVASLFGLVASLFIIGYGTYTLVKPDPTIYLRCGTAGYVEVHVPHKAGYYPLSIPCTPSPYGAR